jgi:hypothetical protein
MMAAQPGCKTLTISKQLNLVCLSHGVWRNVTGAAATTAAQLHSLRALELRLCQAVRHLPPYLQAREIRYKPLPID